MSINFSKLLAQEIEKKKKMKTPPSSKTTRTNENDNDDEKMRKKADELMSDEVFFAQFFTRKPIEDWDTYRVHRRDKPDEFIPGLFYVPEFIHEEEERRINRAIRTQKEAKWVESKGKRKVLNVPAAPNNEKTPLWINALKKALRETTAMDGQNEANHVLINEYNVPAGIDPHFDGIVYNPHVAIVTTTGRALMDFWPKESADAQKEQELVAQVLLQPRSLLIYRDEFNDTNGAYFLRHGIRHSSSDDAFKAHPPSVATIIEKKEKRTLQT
jgi:alkylated DNA repair dioxygenase AlkB